MFLIKWLLNRFFWMNFTKVLMLPTLGIKLYYLQLRESIFLPRMRKYIIVYLDKCLECQ